MPIGESQNLIGGLLELQVNGEIFNSKGEFTYNFGKEKRTGVPGTKRVNGYTSEVQVPYIQGVITDRGDLDVEKLLDTVDATITIKLANGKVAALREGYYAGEGEINTKEGDIAVRFEGMDSEEIRG